MSNRLEFSSAAPLSVLSQEGVRALLGRPCDPYSSYPLPVNSRQYVSCETSKASKIQKSSSHKGIWKIKQCLIGMRYDALRRCCLKNSNDIAYKTKNLKSQSQTAVSNAKTGSNSLIPCFSEKQKPCDDDGVDRFTDTQQMNSSKNCSFGQFYNEGNKSCIDLGTLRYLFALVPIVPRPPVFRPFIPGRNIPSYVYPPVLQNFNYFAPPFLPGPGTAPQRRPAEIILLGEIIEWPSFAGVGDFRGYGQYGATPFSGASLYDGVMFPQPYADNEERLSPNKDILGGHIFFRELFPCNNAVVPYLVFSGPSAGSSEERQCAFNRLTTFGGSGAETVQVCFCWDKNTAGCFCCIGWKLLANRQPCRLLHGEWFRKNKRSDCNFAAGEIPNLTELAGLIPIGDG
ncbi:hypothetical protein T4A_8444 [Trichinella pseudospiralis]|uniref:Uncharacterized protein n=1 Tax=Trichinella pseudospiralis TaxID=6337 RepID=A0A0V1EI99_TRIPS|nr:hypothetical protein T4A_8444 [Trichinella pseudospiralis]